MKMLSVRGVVREGLIVPLGNEELPEGAEVEIVVRATSDIVEAVQNEAVFRPAADEDWLGASEDSWATISWGQN